MWLEDEVPREFEWLPRALSLASCQSKAPCHKEHNLSSQFMHSIPSCLLSAYYVPGYVSGPKDNIHSFMKVFL